MSAPARHFFNFPLPRALGKVGPAEKGVVLALAAAVEGDKVKVVRSDAALALLHMGPAAKDVVPALKGDAEADVRSTVAQALAAIGPGAKDAIPALTAAYKDDKNIYVRIAATHALGKTGGGKEVVSVLVAALKDSQAAVRGAGATALWLIGPDAKEAVPALVTAFKEEKDTDARRYIGDALRGLDPAAAKKAGVP